MVVSILPSLSISCLLSIEVSSSLIPLISLYSVSSSILGYGEDIIFIDSPSFISYSIGSSSGLSSKISGLLLQYGSTTYGPRSTSSSYKIKNLVKN